VAQFRRYGDRLTYLQVFEVLDGVSLEWWRYEEEMVIRMQGDDIRVASIVT
jgi:hypothetical protein